MIIPFLFSPNRLYRLTVMPKSIATPPITNDTIKRHDKKRKRKIIKYTKQKIICTVRRCAVSLQTEFCDKEKQRRNVETL